MTLPQFEVAIGLVWHDGRLLVNRRGGEQHLAGFWEFPGGKIEPGETPEGAAVREVLEEIGVAVIATRRRARIEHRYSDRRVVLWPIECRLADRPPPVLPGQAIWVRRPDLARYEFPEANRDLVAELIAESR